MNTLILKSLHIIFVITMFAGVFYMPRLFVYFAEAEKKNLIEKNILQNQFKIMQRRLWYGITIPSSIAVLIFGGSLLPNFLPLSDHPWLTVKLIFVFFVYAYLYFLHQIFVDQQKNKITFSPLKLRIINEISSILLVAIVFLVVLKNIINMIYGLIGLFIFIVILLIAIKFYKNYREKNERK
jgi:putative membrane protein